MEKARISLADYSSELSQFQTKTKDFRSQWNDEI